MVNYTNAKIYALRSHKTEEIYIGSTCNDFYKRMGQHKSDYKHREVRPYYTAFELLKYDDCYIELIKECPCETKEQLKKEEGEIIRSMECVNKRIEDRDKKEWRDKHKERLIMYRQDRKEHYDKLNIEWREKNPNYHKEWKRQKWICEVCNKSLSRGNKDRHLKTHKIETNM